MPTRQHALLVKDDAGELNSALLQGWQVSSVTPQFVSMTMPSSTLRGFFLVILTKLYAEEGEQP